MSIVILLLVPVAFWLLLVRPQRQRVAAQRALLSGLQAGEEVLTSGGLIGRIVEVRESEVSLEVAPGTVVRVALAAIIGRPQGGSAPEPPPPADPFHNEDAD
jgi:preprotein translocase subunit YajC